MAGAAFTPGQAHQIAPTIYAAAGPGYTIGDTVEPGAKRVASFTFHRQLLIEWGHCDPAGIVFSSRFFEMFDISSWMLFEAALGVKPCDLASTFGIIGIPLVDARANFLKPAKFGDLAEITSWVSEFRRSSFDIEHHLLIDGELAVEGSETRVWAARDKDNPEKIHAHTIPAEAIAKFA
jgi:4-hydroxybenzoyl-CoA thioesterase